MSRWLCVVYGIALTAGLLRPYGGDQPTGIAAIDSHPDLTHFLAFTILGILVGASQFAWQRTRIVLILCAYAIGMELVQANVPGRTVSVVDGMANLLGVLFGLSLCLVFARVTASQGR